MSDLAGRTELADSYIQPLVFQVRPKGRPRVAPG